MKMKRRRRIWQSCCFFVSTLLPVNVDSAKEEEEEWKDGRTVQGGGFMKLNFQWFAGSAAKK